MEYKRIPETKSYLPEAKLAYDARGLIAKAKRQSERLGRPVDPITLAQRTDDDISRLQEELINQIWLSEFKVRYDDPALKKLHEDIQWTDIERSLKADPESMVKLQALDSKGHAMNVFGEENGEYIFASAWGGYEQVSADHRNIAYDPEGEELARQYRHTPNGNAVSIIVNIMGVTEEEAVNYLADPELHSQLINVISVKGWTWLKTDHVARKDTSNANYGNNDGVHRNLARHLNDYGSFRAALRVKKV